MTTGPFGWTLPDAAQRRALVEASWPRASAQEIARRRAAIAEVAAERDVDLVLVYGADRAGSGVPWLTSWPVTREAALLLDLRSGDADLWIQFHNHVPLATELAQDCRVHWGGPVTAQTLVDALSERGSGRRLGVVGPVTVPLNRALAGAVDEIVPLGSDYTRLRLVKSPEELDLLAAGAYLSDLAAAALRDGIREGTTDHEMADLVERAYVPLGGTTHIHYFGITAMDAPDRGAPAQITTGRVLARGDVVVTELSAALEGYAGQVLRTMTLDDRLAAPFDELHAVADAAFDAVCAAIRPGATAGDVVAASGVIEAAGYTIVDDLVHGFGGGYLPPVLGSASRPAGPLPDLVFEAGMTVVVQPNVTTPDHRAGVQTGELVVVTDDGVVSLHDVPRGPWLAAGAGR
ncbi:M24 family metallopeptidase [Egicoccus sp. AB-alg6-2]|uniref:M24 family metallopeptidase n=1 Tax=Egicoccus sp. AB-alg6-2 TaxID=3242692 RepID=UPI00359D995D